MSIKGRNQRERHMALAMRCGYRALFLTLILILPIHYSMHSEDVLIETKDNDMVSSKTPALELLFLGNSYTSNNQLTTTVDNMMNQGGWNPDIVTKTSGGKTIAWHAEQANQENSEWDMALDTLRDYVVVQDQSQVPGFPTNSNYYQDSLDGAQYIDSRAEMINAKTILFMTWGYRNGDSNNEFRYPDYLTMQDHLKNGYQMFAENLTTDERPVFIAPVGLAFKHIFQTVQNQGLDPTDDGTSFSNLYASDDSHPSIHGTYLAACVFYATITGNSPVGLSNQGTSISDDRALELQEAAAATVFNETPNYIYPWQSGFEEVIFGVDSGSVFNINPGSNVGIAVNYTNIAEIDTNVVIDIEGPNGWTVSWTEATDPRVGASFSAPSDTVEWVQFNITAPNVIQGLPLADSIHPFSVHLISDLDGSEDWWNFSMRYGIWKGISLIEGGGSASVEPGGILDLEITLRNEGNLINELGINMIPVNNGTTVGAHGLSFDYNDWTAIIYDRVGLENVDAGQVTTVRIQIQAPILSYGSIDIEFKIWAEGLASSETFSQSVTIVPRSGANLGLTNIDCNFDIKPNEFCTVELFIENTGDAGFLFNLSISEIPDWATVELSQNQRFLGPGQTVHGIQVNTSIGTDLIAGLTGSVTIEVEVDDWIPASVTWDVSVAAEYSWLIIRSDPEVIEGRLTGYWEVQNNGNGPDGIIVSVDSNVFTDFGVLTPWDNLSNEGSRSFEILNIPSGGVVLFEVWMDIPDEAPVETSAIITIEIRSIRDPSVILVEEHSGIIEGAPNLENNQDSDNNHSTFTEFMQRWLQTILIVLISIIGSIGVVIAIRYRIEEDRRKLSSNEPKVVIEEASDWMAKFEDNEDEETEIIVSPTTDFDSFRDEFLGKSGDHSRSPTKGPDEGVISNAREVLEDAFVEDTLIDTIEIADQIKEDIQIHPENSILETDHFSKRLGRLSRNLGDDEEP